MKGTLSDAVARWDAATRHPAYRAIGVVLGLVLAAVVLALPAPTGLGAAGHKTLAVALLMVVWWVGNVLPMAVTAMVPLLAFPLLGVASVKTAAAPFAHPMIFLMLGGFLLAAAMERVGLHNRLTALLLRTEAVRAHPHRVVLALMVVCASLSGLVSNTATMVMMLPLALSLGRTCTDDPRGVSGFALALAYSASIGGTTTLVGTPPNAVFAGIAGENGVDVGFARWMLVGVPFVVVALPIAWWTVTRIVLPLKVAPDWKLDAPPVPSWAPGERSVLAVAGAALLAWFTRGGIDLGAVNLPGWQDLTPYSGSELDAAVAVAAGCAVFGVPVRRAGAWALLLDWKTAERAVPWSVLLLLGGGFSLATGIKDSGLTGWVASGASVLQDLPLSATILIVALGMTGLTELTSNTASTQIALPLLAAAALEAGVDPLVWMVPATLAASCAFMMPIATAPNAIAAEAGGVSPADMALAGAVLNIALALWITCLAVFWVPLVW